MASESVWFEQVDTALVDYITSIVQLENRQGLLVPVPVKIRKPDEDFKVEQYPSITIYNLYSKRDEVRYYPDSIVVARDESKNKLIEEKSAIPYILFYQIDFWSTKQTHMNDMTRLWLGNNPDRDFLLKVKDMSGNDRDCLVLLTDDLKKSDILSGKERTFHSMLTYRVSVEIDERIKKSNYMVTAIPNPETKHM